MKALVTGGGGFLGRYIVEQILARGDEVTVFARGNYPELEEIGAKLIRGDLQDIEAVTRACAGMDAVFHVASYVNIVGPWESYYRTNVVGTQNVIEACRKQDVRKLIYTSTPSVVYNKKSRHGIDESLPYATHFENFYSQTKAMAEQMVTQANGPDLLTVSLRPRLVWGPRDNQILQRLIERARAGKLIQIGDGTNKVDLTYVEDAAYAHLLAADVLEPGAAVAGSVYFITSDAPVNLWDWINNLLIQLDIPPVKRRISLPVARAIGAVLEFVHRVLRLKDVPRLTRMLATEMATDHYYNISRAKRDFGYEPQVGMEEGLRRTVEFFKNQ